MRHIEKRFGWYALRGPAGVSRPKAVRPKRAQATCRHAIIIPVAALAVSRRLECRGTRPQ
jgi:hypothetical protein